MDRIRVLIVDDHPLVRQGIVTFVEEEEDLELTGEASDGQEALALVEQVQPDVILMDLAMPVMDGISATRAITARHPEIKVLVLTSYMDESQIRAALQAGAEGYLLKDMPPDKLIGAIRRARLGEIPLAPEATRRLIQAMRPPRDQAAERLACLSEREREVLAQLKQGRSNKEIARELVISERTVKFHVGGILAKLQLSDRTQAALFAAEHLTE
ncbi:MAG: response regulator [Rudaea sp.]